MRTSPCVNRRRAIAMFAAASATPWSAAWAGEGMTRWRGVALGARASLTIARPSADWLVQASLAEIERLEKVFSLHRADSEVSRLNRDGALKHPSPDMLRVLSIAAAASEYTMGAFDPTVQPLWDLHARWAVERDRLPPRRHLDAVLRRVGWRNLHWGIREVRFAIPGMALTLNGVAQGYIADRVADLLRNEGMEKVLVEAGEVRAMGGHPAGRPWKVGLRGTRIVKELEDRALAVSEPAATLLDAGGKIGHILDPRCGQPGGQWTRAVAQAPSAALADALSTGACLMEPPQIDNLRRICETAEIAVFRELPG